MTAYTSYVCPMCEAWQLDFDVETLSTYVNMKMGDNGQMYPDTAPVFRMVDGIFRDHLNECMESRL